VYGACWNSTDCVTMNVMYPSVMAVHPLSEPLTLCTTVGNDRRHARWGGALWLESIHCARGGTARGLPYGTPSGAESDMVYERWGENGAVTRSTQRAIERILIQRARVKG
jgi:hypothetical protein